MKVYQNKKRVSRYFIIAASCFIFLTTIAKAQYDVITTAFWKSYEMESKKDYKGIFA